MGTQQLVLLAAQMPVYTGDFFAAILVVIFAAILRRGPGNEDASRPGKFAPSARCHAHSAHLWFTQLSINFVYVNNNFARKTDTVER